MVLVRVVHSISSRHQVPDSVVSRVKRRNVLLEQRVDSQLESVPELRLNVLIGRSELGDRVRVHVYLLERDVRDVEFLGDIGRNVFRYHVVGNLSDFFGSLFEFLYDRLALRFDYVEFSLPEFRIGNLFDFVHRSFHRSVEPRHELFERDVLLDFNVEILHPAFHPLVGTYEVFDAFGFRKDLELPGIP